MLPTLIDPLDRTAAALGASIDTSPVGHGLFDADDRLVYGNASFRHCLAIAPTATPTWEAMLRRCHAERAGLLIETDDIDAWLARVRGSYRRVPVRVFQSDLCDGRWMHVTETLHPSGHLLIVMVDISALKASESSLRAAHERALQASLTDVLTGLYNRRYMFQRLEDMRAATLRSQAPLCVVMIDLDRFKQINDCHGHVVGDRVLVHFGEQLRAHLRPDDAVGRIGGEEFLLLLPCELAGGVALLDRIRLGLARSTPLAEEPSFRYSFSAGLAAALPRDSTGRLLARADRALYVAKGRGRNCHVAFEGEGQDWASNFAPM